MNRRSLIPTVLSLPSSTTVWPTDLGSSFLAVTCLRSVTFLVVLELFFSSRLPWVVHSILVGLLLSLKFTDSPLEHAICHLFENGRCKPLCKPRLSRHTVFPTSTTLFILGKVENLKRVFFPCRIVHSIWAIKKTEHSSLTLFLRAFRHLETLYVLSPVFTQTGSRNYPKCLLCTSTICFQRSQDSWSAFTQWATMGFTVSFILQWTV